MNQGKQPSPGWNTVVKTTTQYYVVFEGFQTGIYTNWPTCFSQVNKYRGACYKSYPTLEMAKQAYQEYMTNKVNQQVHGIQRTTHPHNQITDFYNPGLSGDIYEDFNGIWKNHLIGEAGKKQFRVHMSKLAQKVKDLSEDLEREKSRNQNLEWLSVSVINHINWNDEFINYAKINTFFELSTLLENKIASPQYEKIKRICLFEKAKHHLPNLTFEIIAQKVHDQETIIPDLFLEFTENLNIRDNNLPKFHFSINHEPWSLPALEWGLVNELVFHNHGYEQLIQLPALIRSMFFHVAKYQKRIVYYSFTITSTLGWRKREKFYQPYQIWYLYRPFGEIEQQQAPDNEALAESIQGPYALREYWIKTAAHFIKTVRTGFDSPFKITDGRRIFITNLPVSYKLSPEQLESALDLLTQIKFEFSSLDVPETLSHLAEELFFQQHFADQDSPQRLSSPEEETNNIINHMEG